MSLTKEKKTELIEQYRRSDDDTGSPDVQIAVLTQRINEFTEHLKGSLEVGKLADVVILDQNLFEISPEKILDTRVIMTVCDGKIVFQN